MMDDLNRRKRDFLREAKKREKNNLLEERG
jgi:hypothetical protein